MKLLLIALVLTPLMVGLPIFAAESKRDDSASEKLGIKLSLQCYTYRALTFFETVDKAADSNIALTRWYRKRLKLDVEAAGEPAIAHGLQPDREPLGVAVLVARTYLRAASYRIPRSIGPFDR